MKITAKLVSDLLMEENLTKAILFHVVYFDKKQKHIVQLKNNTQKICFEFSKN